MFVPQGTPPLFGTSFARIAAEMGLTQPTHAHSRKAASAIVSVPAQRSAGRPARAASR